MGKWLISQNYRGGGTNTAECSPDGRLFHTTSIAEIAMTEAEYLSVSVNAPTHGFGRFGLTHGYRLCHL